MDQWTAFLRFCDEVSVPEATFYLCPGAEFSFYDILR